MVLGFGLALTSIWLMGGFGLLAPARDQLIWSTLAGSLCFFLIGLADDLFALSPWPRLAGQVVVASVIWSQGVQIGAIDLPWISSPGTAIVLPDSLSLIATVIWLVGITNAINWLDGLDGLAAGVAGIAAVGLVSVSFSLHQVAAGFLAAALAGALQHPTVADADAGPDPGPGQDRPGAGPDPGPGRAGLARPGRVASGARAVSRCPIGRRSGWCLASSSVSSCFSISGCGRRCAWIQQPWPWALEAADRRLRRRVSRPFPRLSLNLVLRSPRRQYLSLLCSRSSSCGSAWTPPSSCWASR